MEDGGTLRISSQHLASWLHHGVCSEVDIDPALEKDDVFSTEFPAQFSQRSQGDRDVLQVQRKSMRKPSR